jgi:hypothetical protein
MKSAEGQWNSDEADSFEVGLSLIQIETHLAACHMRVKIGVHGLLMLLTVQYAEVTGVHQNRPNNGTQGLQVLQDVDRVGRKFRFHADIISDKAPFLQQSRSTYEQITSSGGVVAPRAVSAVDSTASHPRKYD